MPAVRRLARDVFLALQKPSVSSDLAETLMFVVISALMSIWHYENFDLNELNELYDLATWIEWVLDVLTSGTPLGNVGFAGHLGEINTENLRAWRLNHDFNRRRADS